MKLILAPRGGGKTAELIKMSNQRGGYIVCTTHRQVDHIAQAAKEMGLSIPYPLTLEEFINKRYHGKGIKEFYIDNVSEFLQALTSVPIEAVTDSVNDPHLEIKFLTRSAF